MKADTTPLHLLFKKEIQYVVPLYQRPYVWREETHWAPLWEDILAVVGQVETHDRGADGEVQPHFLGAVVLEERRGPVVSIERRFLIDGQQRLTTLQILLAAGSRVATAMGLDKHARQLRGLIGNDLDYVVEPNDVFKVWPTNIDRSAFRAVMLQEPRWEVDDPFNLIQEAYRFFYESFQDRVPRDLDDARTWFEYLTQAVRNHIHLVVIDLDERDNPQVIFETLNARGTPLLAIDLVKNLLFMRAQREGHDVDELYRRHWRHLERARWRENIRQGRLTRPRVEIFLMHWLTMKRREDVLSHQLYNAFRAFTKETPAPAAELVIELADDAEVFDSFDQHLVGTPEHKFFRTLAVLDTTTLLPLVLALYKAKIPHDRLRVCFAALESWLVRRMLCGLTTQNYNRFVLELLNLAAKDESHADALALDRLRGAEADANRWPRDAEVTTALTRMPFYGRLSQARQRFVLAAIERRLRSIKAESVALPDGLTIEHVMPQSWREHWPLRNPDDLAAEAERNARVQRIGNLTLVTAAMNAAASNAAWPSKREALDRHSLLLLNRELVRENADGWTDEDIDRRSVMLAQRVCEIWRDPEERWSAEIGEREAVLEHQPLIAERAPSAEDLIEAHAPVDASQLMLQFLEDVSFWDDVTIRVGKAKEDRGRRIYFSRRGSPYGAFCRVFPTRAVARFRLDLSDVPFAKGAEAVAAADPYRVRMRFQTQESVSEALALARRAWDLAVADDEAEL